MSKIYVTDYWKMKRLVKEDLVDQIGQSGVAGQKPDGIEVRWPYEPAALDPVGVT